MFIVFFYTVLNRWRTEVQQKVIAEVLFFGIDFHQTRYKQSFQFDTSTNEVPGSEIRHSQKEVDVISNLLWKLYLSNSTVINNKSCLTEAGIKYASHRNVQLTHVSDSFVPFFFLAHILHFWTCSSTELYSLKKKKEKENRKMPLLCQFDYFFFSAGISCTDWNWSPIVYDHSKRTWIVIQKGTNLRLQMQP